MPHNFFDILDALILFIFLSGKISFIVGIYKISTFSLLIFFLSDVKFIGYFLKSLLELNCRGFKKILTTTISDFFFANLINSKCPLCNEPKVGTNPIFFLFYLFFWISLCKIF